MEQPNITTQLAALDDAIAHAKDVAERQKCTECGKQHRQLAAWLQELKAIKLAPAPNGRGKPTAECGSA